MGEVKSKVMCKAMEYAQRISDTLQEAIDERERLGNIVHECDLKTCDLLHKIELQDVKGMYDAYKTIQELRTVRKTRRNAKDEVRVLKLVAGLDYQNLVIDIDEELRRMEKRQYNPRIDYKPTQL